MKYKVPHAHIIGAFFFQVVWANEGFLVVAVECSVHGESGAFLTPAACERHGRFARPHAPPGIALKTAAARSTPLRLHLADRAGLNIPVLTGPLTAVLDARLRSCPFS